MNTVDIKHTHTQLKFRIQVRPMTSHRDQTLIEGETTHSHHHREKEGEREIEMGGGGRK